MRGGGGNKKRKLETQSNSAFSIEKGCRFNTSCNCGNYILPLKEGKISAKASIEKYGAVLNIWRNRTWNITS